jgi:predicted Zn-dependent protease with MMP-like domain
VFKVSNERFDEFVKEALASLPHDLAKEMSNVGIYVEDEAVGRPLFGLFQGIPLTKRGPLSYAGVLPDRITLYQGAISRYADTEDEVRAQVRKTLIHEIAHHFGISDERLTELGWS